MGECSSPQGQEEQEGSKQGDHRHTVAQVVEDEGSMVVQLVLQLLDGQTFVQSLRRGPQLQPLCSELEGILQHAMGLSLEVALRHQCVGVCSQLLGTHHVGVHQPLMAQGDSASREAPL